LNLPEVPIEDEYVDYSVVLEMFGEPSSYDFTDEFFENDERTAIGLWYKIYDIVDGIYIPIKPINIIGGIAGNPHPLLNKGENETIRVNKLIEDSKILKKIFVYLYGLYPDSFLLNYDRRNNLLDFFEN